MTILGTRLTTKLRELFDQERVVVWRDDSGLLRDRLRAALPEGVRMPELKGTTFGNPLSLRAAIDGEDPWLTHKWLLYVSKQPELPGGQPVAWLADYEQQFTCVSHGNVAWVLRELCGATDLPPELQARLQGDAAKTLLEHFGELFPEGRPSISADDARFALLKAALGESAASELQLVMMYLTDDQDARRLESLGLDVELTRLIGTRLGLRRRMTEGSPPDRAELCRCLVASALVESGAADAKPLSNQLPQEEHRARWSKMLLDTLARDDETSRSLRERIRASLEGSKLIDALTDPMRLAHAPPLRFVNLRMLDLLYRARPTAGEEAAWWTEVAAVADARGAVAGLDAATRGLWSALRTAASLLERTRAQMIELDSFDEDCFERLAKDYVEPAGGNHEIDALFHGLPPAEQRIPNEWREALIEPSRKSYHRWTRALTERFVRAAGAHARYSVRGSIRHTAFWTTLVERAQRPAVLLVDALRADLAYALRDRVAAKQRVVEPHFALAELPTRTEVGMAALLPGAEALEVRVEEGRLVSWIGDRRVRDVTERTRWLEEATTRRGTPVVRAQLEDMLSVDAKLLTDTIRAGKIPLAHTTGIDEAGPVAAAVSFDPVHALIERCAQFVDAALQRGCGEVLIAGDHGFLVRDADAPPLAVRDTASGPGLARGLRYAAGAGTTASLVELSPKVLGRGSVSVFVPSDDRCLALQGGAGPFVHGGLSPQECALVFLRVLPGAGRLVARPADVRLVVEARPKALSFRVEIHTEATREPLLTQQRRVDVRISDAQGLEVFRTASPSIVRAAATPQQSAIVPTVPRPGGYTVALVDADTGLTLSESRIEVEVLGDDFGF